MNEIEVSLVCTFSCCNRLHKVELVTDVSSRSAGGAAGGSDGSIH